MLKEIFERNYPDFKSELSSILASKNLKTNTNPQEYARIIIDQFKNIINFIDTELYQFEQVKKENAIWDKFLFPKVAGCKKFQNILFAIIHFSKFYEPAEKLAKTAIALLSGAGIKFINQDFSNIRIREAFITNGIFVNTSFKNAD